METIITTPKKSFILRDHKEMRAQEKLKQIPIPTSVVPGTPLISSIDFTIEDYFPDIGNFASNIKPQDGAILLQVQYQPKYMGLIATTDDTQKNEQYQRSLCKILAIGDNAFYSKTSGRKWVNLLPGDFVIAPSMQGRRLKTNHPTEDKSVIHVIICADSDIEASVQDPMVFIKGLAK